MEIKRITLHPVLDDGTVDTNVNLYPKKLLRGIVNDTGEEVDVITRPILEEELAEKADKSEIPTNYVTLDTQQVILAKKTFVNLDASDITAESINLSNYTITRPTILDATRLSLYGGQVELNLNGLNTSSGFIGDDEGIWCIKKKNVDNTYGYYFPNKSGTIALTDDCGTKLYKHTIVLNFDNGDDDFEQEIDFVDNVENHNITSVV